jgi:FixJ family two-component response regulator
MNPPAQSTVYLVDDDVSILRATARVLSASGFQVRPFHSPLDFLAQALPDEPGCIVLDLQMPGLTGLELQERLRKVGAVLPIIFLTDHGGIPESVQAMRQGAEDFLPKSVLREQLLEAIRRAIARYAAGREERRQLAAIKARFARLTPKERQVLAAVLAGQLNKEIAADMGVDERSIKRHRARCLVRLQARTLPELARLAPR